MYDLLVTLQCSNAKSFEGGQLSPPPNTFHINHVRNMLHVMCGERPVPSLRTVGWTHVKEIDEISQRCTVQITKGIFTDPKTGDTKYIYFPMQTRKDSESLSTAMVPIRLNGTMRTDFNAPHDMTWDRLRCFMGGYYYDGFETMVNEYLGTGLVGNNSISVFNVIEQLNEIRDRIKDHPFWQSQFIESNQKVKPLKVMFRHIIIDGISAGQYFGKTGYQVAKETYEFQANRGYDKFVRNVSGLIFVPLYKEELKLLDKGTGFATILDGGLVKIKSICRFDQLIITDSVPLHRG